ncbi:MAG: type IV pilus assembly protein PilM [Candidatus Vogelbacteria bacterium]|nr:type IV pilus assembly protein PilM [Candidatus Vogelbacteria bacterium]
MVHFFPKFFPTPKYLARPAVGLDISDQSVKFFELARSGDRFKIVRYGEQAIPAGAIEAGIIKDEAGLVAVLEALRAEHGLADVAMSLPEEEAYVIRLALPYVAPTELKDSLELQLEEHIPLPADEIVFDYEILTAPNDARGDYDLSLSAFPKNTIASYTAALAAAGLTPLAAEIEAQAIARSVVRRGDERLTMIVDFGKTRTSFFIASGAVVLFTATAAHIGGEDLTKSIQKNLNLSYNEAERLKIERGLLTIKKHQELFFSILPIVSVLRDEIIKHFSWWDSRRGDHSRFDRAIERVVVCGGQATLPGLIDYLNLNLDWPVELGNPWSNVFSLETYIPPINLNQSLRYTTSLGLALRGLLPVND